MNGGTHNDTNHTKHIQIYGTKLARDGYAMLTLWLAVAVAAVSAMMMPAKRRFVK